jgi:xylulokinase
MAVMDMISVIASGISMPFNRMGIDPSLLPPLTVGNRSSWRTVASASAARETGLPEGTPVIAGTGDAAAEMVGTGVVDEGSLALLYGSTSGNDVSCVPGTVCYLPGFILTPGLGIRSYLVSSVLGTGCALIEWIRGHAGMGWSHA